MKNGNFRLAGFARCTMLVYMLLVETPLIPLNPCRLCVVTRRSHRNVSRRADPPDSLGKFHRMDINDLATADALTLRVKMFGCVSRTHFHG